MTLVLRFDLIVVFDGQLQLATTELSRLKVDQLKFVINNFNDTFHAGARFIKITGNKNELVRPHPTLALAKADRPSPRVQSPSPD